MTFLLKKLQTAVNTKFPAIFLLSQLHDVSLFIGLLQAQHAHEVQCCGPPAAQSIYLYQGDLKWL